MILNIKFKDRLNLILSCYLLIFYRKSNNIIDSNLFIFNSGKCITLMNYIGVSQ